MSNFEFDGDEYEKASKHQQEWGEKLIKELGLSGGEDILDLGCGDGKLTAKIAAQVPEGKVVGIDASQGMIDSAKQRETDNLSFRLQDINQLDYQEEFDLIFSNAALHWVKDHEQLLENCLQALKTGGLIRFNFAGDGNCSNLYYVLEEVMSLPQFKEEFADFSWPWYMPAVKEYKSLVRSSGFEEVEVWGENADRYFADEEEMIRWIDQLAIVPFLENLPKKKEEEFRNLVVNKMIERTRES